MVASAPTRPPQDVAEDAERCMREYDLNSDNKISIEEWNKVEEHFFEEVIPTRCSTHAQFCAADNQADCWQVWDWVRDIQEDCVIDREMDRYQQKVKQAFGMDCGESVYAKEGNVTDEKEK